MKMKLTQAVDFYLQTRRRFGFALVQTGVELRSFVRYTQNIGHTGPLTAGLAADWAKLPRRCHPGYWAYRLGIARRFAEFWRAYEPRTEIPDRNGFSQRYRRRPVHIFSPEELKKLMEASAQLDRVHRFRGSTFRILVGLLYGTGLRIGEALNLRDQDIDATKEVLTIRQAKCGHTRVVPVQASTLEALQGYRALRQKTFGSGAASRFFVDFRGKPLGYHGVSAVFRELCRGLGWTDSPVPRLHDLRHTFAVRTLLGWYRNGGAMGPKLWILSTYLGHRHLADTYWYLTAVPELMQLCQERFAAAQTWASEGGVHA